MNNDMRFEEFFVDRLRERGFDLKKLSEASGIAIKHLEALARGNFKALPPAPYFHGYLKRLGQILEFDSEAWWQKLKDGGFVKSSGETDAIPKNRFIRNISRKKLGVIVIVIVIVLYLFFQLPRALGKPELTVVFPKENPAVVSSQEITLVGSAKNASELYINRELVPLAEDGTWSKVVSLGSSSMPTPFEIRAKKFLGGETRIIQQIIYQAVNGAGNNL